MIIPAAMFIESAVDRVVRLSAEQRDAQRKELHVAMGDPTLVQLGASVPMHEDFVAGYQLGLETMRVLILTTPNPSKLV